MIETSSGILLILTVVLEREHRIGFMEMFNAMSQIQSQLAACDDVQNVLDVVVGLVSEVSGFHRVRLCVYILFFMI